MKSFLENLNLFTRWGACRHVNLLPVYSKQKANEQCRVSFLLISCCLLASAAVAAGRLRVVEDCSNDRHVPVSAFSLSNGFSSLTQKVFEHMEQAWEVLFWLGSLRAWD